MAINLGFCVSAMNLDDIFSSATGYPLKSIQVVYNVTGCATALAIFD